MSDKCWPASGGQVIGQMAPAQAKATGRLAWVSPSPYSTPRAARRWTLQLINMKMDTEKNGVSRPRGIAKKLMRFHRQLQEN
jgi:hypothetical protein